MNDLYLTNGKTGHYRSLGLPKADKVKAEWPTPRQIKLNVTKRETVPVAFRIDEVAYTMLNLFANQCELTTSAFVNELINSYIEQHQHEVDGSVFHSTINLSIDRLASKLKKMSIEQAMSNYNDLHDTIELITNRKLPKTDNHFNSPETLREILEAGHFQYLQTHFFNCCIDVGLNEKASIVDLREEDPNNISQFGFQDFEMDIPYKKWIFVEPLLSLCHEKCEQFLEKYEYTDICNDMEYDEIVEIINDFDGPELIEKLTEKLKFKGGIWSKTLQR